MTNTAKLKEKIESSGLKLAHIAAAVGITRQQLWKKINNRVAFNQYEIAAICKVLNIKSLKEKEDIFFTEIVD